MATAILNCIQHCAALCKSFLFIRIFLNNRVCIDSHSFQEPFCNAIGNLILEAQQPFFRSGPGYLRIFTQAEAAGALNVHESTISRAIHGKYLQCTWGVFPLQHFFPQGLQQRHEIYRQIQQMIACEDKCHPLSDQALCTALGEAGYSISRRMVSKYRESLKIPDAGSRRKYDK